MSLFKKILFINLICKKLPIEKSLQERIAETLQMVIACFIIAYYIKLSFTHYEKQ